MLFRSPARITLLKTTGREDLNLPYCRGPLIVFPENWLRRGADLAGRILAHELFYVFATAHPALRPELYALLEFEPCEELTFPAKTDNRRLTNPDAPRYDYFTRLRLGEREIAVIPAMIARTEHFDPAPPINVFAQTEFRLLEIELKDGRALGSLAADGTLRSHSAEALPDYRARMAQNTDYIWHPEEVLADNFAHLLVPPKTPLANRELPARLLRVMQKR